MVANDLAENRIRSRAYQIHREHGSQPGHELDDWVQAEYELMQLPVRKLAELPPPKSPNAKSKFPSIIQVVRAAMLM